MPSFRGTYFFGDWTGKITRLSGPSLGTVQDYVVGLPRSVRDHLTNSLAFGPDGKLYVGVGSLSNIGNPFIKPEKSDTWTVGVIWEPVPGLSGTLDYWNINTKDQITIGSGQAMDPTTVDAPILIPEDYVPDLDLRMLHETATDEIVIKVHGRGGHAAMPHLTVDPVVTTAQIISALQSIASRNASPLDSIVVTVDGSASANASGPIVIVLPGPPREQRAVLREPLLTYCRSISSPTTSSHA